MLFAGVDEIFRQADCQLIAEKCSIRAAGAEYGDLAGTETGFLQKLAVSAFFRFFALFDDACRELCCDLCAAESPLADQDKVIPVHGEHDHPVRSLYVNVVSIDSGGRAHMHAFHIKDGGVQELVFFIHRPE